MNYPLHVEIVQLAESQLQCRHSIIKLVQNYLETLVSIRPGSSIVNAFFDDHQQLKDNVFSINFCDIDQSDDNINLCSVVMEYHVYTLRKNFCEIETVDNEADDDSGLPAANVWSLPSADFYGLWESLVYDSHVKEDTLHFVETTLLFSDHNVNPNIVNWNRVILLHGPPGTGKTSLCKALAQKLSIRLNHRYIRGHFIEINSHSLFSKWFSESGKLVMALFNKIREIVSDSNALVCILLDEVESLTHARKSALSGTEPSDSIRAVNAILTQIDQMKKFSNVLIMTTSNVTEAIDLAFVDRADIKQYIGLPSETAIYQIYHSCIDELMATNIIIPKEQLFSFTVLKTCNFENIDATSSSLKLLNIAKASVGLSGRTLRKIPFLTHALFITNNCSSLNTFLDAMFKAVRKQFADSEMFTRDMANLKIENGH